MMMIQNSILFPFREARDENSIRTPKSVLHAMRKNAGYFCTKLGMIHKRAGLQFLKDEYRSKTTHYRYKGYHCFKDKKEVQTRFEKGKPLSCFILDGNFNQVHVAYYPKENSHPGGHITFSTFKYETSDLHNKEAGVHFCRFVQLEEDSKKSFDTMNITHYALMLPFLHPRKDMGFRKQFTLIYSDWDVLRCDLPDKRKGKASTKNKLFRNL